MNNTRHPPERIPRSSQPFRFSGAVLGLLFAATILAVTLIFSTLQNINREQQLMEKFLHDKGEAIMRSIEAGSRVTMMQHMGVGDPLHTLLNEYAKDPDILYISISDIEGDAGRRVGRPPRPPFQEEELQTIMAGNTTITRLDKKAGVFSLSKVFEIDIAPMRMHMHAPGTSRTRPGSSGKKILSVGLLTHQFDAAREQDVRHAIFMGAILFLVGSAAFYFIFLYQKMRIASSSLANIKLYTDNVIESIPVGLITLDADNRIVSCNRQTENLFEMSFASLLSREIGQVLPDCPSSLKDSCSSLLEKETECTTASGRLIPLRLSCSPLFDDEDQEIGKVLILRDMSSIKEMELQLERSRRMAALGKMAAGIAHEIRNPLGTLRGFAQYFGSRAENDEGSDKYAELMISEIDRLNQTISGLLQFSRPREPQLQRVEIAELFSKTVSLMAADLTSKDIALHWPKTIGTTVKADPDLLLQVLMNLLKNSISAIEAGGEVTFACREEEQMVLLSIADNGCGMSEEVRQKMFDPFYTTLKTGTGLGLAVSHQIVEQHGGSFEVETAPGTGTIITIRLPK